MSTIRSENLSHVKNLKIAVCYQEEASESVAEQLANELGLELYHSSNLSTKNLDFLLLFKDGILSLKEAESLSEIKVDFSSISKSRLNKKLQLAKAVGLKSSLATVIDATAGMGRDAYSLAALGCNITMIEQSNIIAALLKDGLKRHLEVETDIINRMSLVEGNAMNIIPKLESHDVIYIDPMFEDRAKQALPKKEMQMFRKLLGHDDKVDQLFEVALAHAKKRVVVKRHRTAKPLQNKKPHAELTGKQTRFDIYLTT